MVLCVVKGCDSKSRGYTTGVMFHRIPAYNKELYIQWLAAMNIDLQTPVEYIKKWRVCSEHFGPEDYKENKDSTVRRLKDTAIPTIFRVQIGPSVSSSPMTDELDVQQDRPELEHFFSLFAGQPLRNPDLQKNFQLFHRKSLIYDHVLRAYTSRLKGLSEEL
ncbi:peroxynitrite isomerase THAP4-like [Pimephales promelas]|uniref:peroxynitrite isomerase THAP4-like n=1 Tax=Pimephales promelas TaxID=90988 RepID=UPI001955C149|nr:peroxynitrite isomerase THAP4-like [Pimephales promelas]